MDYSGELALIQQQLAQSHDMAARRVAVLDALQAAPGERILEVGCGSGLCLRPIGVAVGATGRVVGLDLSRDQVEAAAAHCDGLAQVEARVGDLRAVPAPPGDFDATVSMQVLEYVAEVDDAVTELARVTRPGGRFVNVATNWGALFWRGGDDDLTARILSAWHEHAPHPNLPVGLPRRLRSAGFDAVKQRPVAIVNRHCHPGTFSHGIARLMAAFACDLGAVERDAAGSWLAGLERADADGEFFVSSVPVLTTATRAV
jgi:SAM-dependent methyltransferase